MSLHTVVLACLDEEARLYPKMALVKRKAVIGGRVPQLPPQDRHQLLAAILEVLLPVYKHHQYGIYIRNSLTGEVLSAVLQICFAPEHAKGHPDDCNRFRMELESMLNSVEATISLRHLLLIRGIAATIQKSVWLLGVCTALCVRRFLLREKLDGVRLVVRAGLDLADGDDWRQCEAVATLVARARVQDVEAFYKIIGPQVARILASDECRKVGGGVLRVMSIILSMLMQRSPSLSMQYLARPLLLPLLRLTEGSGASAFAGDKGCEDVNRDHGLDRGENDGATSTDSDDEEGIRRTKKPIWSDKDEVERCINALQLAVVCGGGGEGCAAVLAPVLCPLLAVAAVPPPCRTRSPATSCIVKHLSNSPNSSCVEKLLVMVGLRSNSAESPPLQDGIRLHINDDGGVTATPARPGGRHHACSSSGYSGEMTEEQPAKPAAEGISSEGCTKEGEDVCDCSEGEEDAGLSEQHCLKERLEQDCRNVEALVRILCQLKNPTAVRKFYSELPKFLNFSTKPTEKNLLLTLEEEAKRDLSSFRVVVLVCELLGRLSEEQHLLESVFGSLSDAMPMLRALLAAACQPCYCPDLRTIQETMLLNVVLLLCHLICGPGQAQNLTSSDWSSLQSLVETLRRLKSTSNNEATVDFLDQLEHSILTHGAVGDTCSRETMQQVKKKFGSRNASSRPWKSSRERGEKPTSNGEAKKEKTSKRQHAVDSKIEKSKKEAIRISNLLLDEDDDDDDDDDDIPLDDRLSSFDASVYNPMGTSSSPDANALALHSAATGRPMSALSATSDGRMPVNCVPATATSNFSTAMEDICSPLLPVRGHALLSLTKLVEARDLEAIASKKKLLALFEHNLKDDDSYIYLTAVEGLAVLCDVYPEKAVPAVCDQIHSKRSVADRTKMTEALTRAARRLGALLPQHKKHFFNALLNGVRDSDALIRTASLSSLGEVCKELRFTIGPVVGEILKVVANVVQCDESDEPRRAAVLLVTLLLRGLDTDAIKVLGGLLRDLYRSLRLLSEREKDEVTRIHAQLALDEVDSLTRAFLLPKLSNTKKIYVTQPPPTLF